MGATCSHDRLEEKETIESGKNLVMNKSIVIYECRDCGQQIAREFSKGRLTNATYSSKEISAQSCKHEHFIVDDSTVVEKSESTLGGTVLGMMTAHWLEPRQRFSLGVAECKVCKKKFRVRADFRVETYWQDKQQKSRTIKDDWKICQKSVPTNQTRQEIDYV